MKAFKRIVALLLVLALAVSMAACGETKKEETAQPVQQEEEKSKYGGTLIVSQIGQQYEDNYYPPLAANADILQNIRPCLEPLFEMGSDGSLIPFLVESYDVEENGKIYTFHIRQGVKFHDGTDFNAEAVKWNIEQTMAGGVHTVFSGVDTMEVTDTYTLRVTMAQSDLFFLNTLASSQAGYMVSPTSVQTNGEEWAKTNPVGTGPFTFKSWDYGVEVVFERNANYWGKDADGNQLPYLDGITFKFVTEEVSVLTSFENGEIDMLRHLSSTALAELEKDYPTTVYDYPASAMYLWFPTAVEGSVFQDVRVRQAVSYALDMPTIISSLYGSEFSAVNQLSYEGSELYDTTIAGYEYNPEKAKALLKEAGLENGFSTSIIMENNEQNAILLQTIQSYLGEVGIDLTIDLADSARYAQTVIFSSWGDQLAIIPFNYSPDEICSMLRMLDPETSLFAHTIKYPDAYKTKIKEMAGSSSLEAAKKIYLELDKILIDETCLVVPVYVNSYAIANQEYVHGTGSGADGEQQIRYWSPETVYLDK